jgi:hypothetical protein
MVITMKKKNSVIRKILSNPATFLFALISCYFECVKTTICGNKTSTHKELILMNSISLAVSAIFLVFCPWGLTSLGYLTGSLFMRLAEALGGGVASADSISYDFGRRIKNLVSGNHIGSFYNFCATANNYWIGVRFVLLTIFSIITVAMIIIATISMINIYKECREVYVDSHYEKALYHFLKKYRTESKINKVINHEIDIDDFDYTYLYDLKLDYRYKRFYNEPEVQQLVYDMELVLFIQDYETKGTSVFDMKADKRFKKFKNEEMVQHLYEAKRKRAARMA